MLHAELIAHRAACMSSADTNNAVIQVRRLLQPPLLLFQPVKICAKWLPANAQPAVATGHLTGFLRSDTSAQSCIAMACMSLPSFSTAGLSQDWCKTPNSCLPFPVAAVSSRPDQTGQPARLMRLVPPESPQRDVALPDVLT